MSFLIRVILVLLSIFLMEYYFTKKTGNILKSLFSSISEKTLKKFKRYFLIFFNLYPAGLIFFILFIFISGDRSFRFPDSIFIDLLIIFPFWIFLLLMFQSTIWFIVSDLLKLSVYPYYKKRKEKLLHVLYKIQFVVLVIFSIYVPGRIAFDYFSVEVRETTFIKKNLPENLNGFKIALIADIQADRYTNESRLNNYLEKVNSQNPDLILIAGDLITSTPNFIETSAKALSRLKAKHSVYICIGDHDNWAYRPDSERSLSEINTALQKYNLSLMDNEKRVLEIDSSTIGITFITNTYVERIPQQELDSLVNGNMDYDLKIFLTHQPRNYLIEKAVEHNYDLYLAGHTHGGQVTFFSPYINLTPTLMETNYVKGDFWFDDMLMIINRGLGMSIAPVRYNSTPEITIISLDKKEN